MWMTKRKKRRLIERSTNALATIPAGAPTKSLKRATRTTAKWTDAGWLNVRSFAPVVYANGAFKNRLISRQCMRQIIVRRDWLCHEKIHDFHFTAGA